MIEKSKEILERALKDYEPYATVALFSGGTDSLLLVELLKELNHKPDFILHVHTGTGLPQTLEYVRRFCSSFNGRYIEAPAGDAYEKYVLRKGFFGKGNDAHEYSYHTLKTVPLEKGLSKYIRHGKRNRKILLLNGIRIEESDNRKKNYLGEDINIYSRKPNNIWVNVIHWWTADQKNRYLEGTKAEINPVAKELGRSGECMCGTMQGTLDRIAASKFCPAWGKWLDDLEKKVIEKGFPWKWGEKINKAHFMEKDGQLNMFQPMCVGCKALG